MIKPENSDSSKDNDPWASPYSPSNEDPSKYETSNPEILRLANVAVKAVSQMLIACTESDSNLTLNNHWMKLVSRWVYAEKNERFTCVHLNANQDLRDNILASFNLNPVELDAVLSELRNFYHIAPF